MANLYRLLVIIPCLNEEAYIGSLLAQLVNTLPETALIVVTDGRSTDRTREIVETAAALDSRIRLHDNPQRLQSAGLNSAVAAFGQRRDWLLRMDAHSGYPDDYAKILMEEAVARGADSVVVSAVTQGTGTVQRANAVAQNSKIGNGGSKHRDGGEGQWVDHGHHALMSIAAFQAVGGYDDSFSHNEDAELDCRLRKAGYRIFMTDLTCSTYYPRDTLGALFKQYVNYGCGRARTVLKHRAVPKIRQLVPLMVVPTLVLTLLTPFSALALVPASIWVSACLLTGAALAWREKNPFMALSGVSAMVMHLGWSWGFWQQLAASRLTSRPIKEFAS